MTAVFFPVQPVGPGKCKNIGGKECESRGGCFTRCAPVSRGNFYTRWIANQLSTRDTRRAQIKSAEQNLKKRLFTLSA